MEVNKNSIIKIISNLNTIDLNTYVFKNRFNTI